ncbi:MAG: hypothetical protein OEZ57_01750 [Nitrospirota bacterium]|nr:hypothetical protein [Nitrospirota bacterium]MDH5587676.1 hypothetical protein [Nitrospirota bacterium]MDH5773625.1 hypothetical protein [Nitrospirota bacterium]
MNILTSTSWHQENCGSRIYPVAKGRQVALIVSLVALSCLAFSPAWAENNNQSQVPVAPIHLTSLSIQIGPGGFHFGIGSPFYGPAYVRPHIHVVPGSRHYWGHSRHQGHRGHYAAPQRNYRSHGGKNDGHLGSFGGNGGGGNRGHRGGHR